MASPAPAPNEPDSSRVLTITVSSNNILLVGPEALNSTNIYDRLGISRTGEHKVGEGPLRDLILFVNGNGTLSLEGETLTNILAASAAYAMNGFKFLKRGKIAEELPESEISKYVVDFPPGLLADPVLELPQPTISVPPEMTDLFDIDIPEAMERLQSALQSADAKIILGENASAMLDILGVDETEKQPITPGESLEIVKKDHTYSRLSASQSSDTLSDKWTSTPPSPQKDSANTSSVSSASNSIGPKANAKVTRVTIGTLDDIVGLTKSCVQHKERAKTLVAQLPSIPPQLLGGSPVKSPPVLKARSSITEAMLDEKLRQELLDNDEYGPGSGGSSEADVKRYIFSPDKQSTFPRSLDSSFNSIPSPQKEVKPPAPIQRKGASSKVKKSQSTKRSKANKAVESKNLSMESKKRTVVVEKVIAPKTIAKQAEPEPLPESEKKPVDTKAAASKKHYPKRENRRPPGRLQDALQPPLFSTPDVIRRFSTDVKPEEKEADIPVFEPEEVEESPPKVVTLQNRVPVVDTVLPPDDLASLPGPTETPKKAKEAVQAPKLESALTKNAQKENQEDTPVPPEPVPANTEPKVSKRIRKRKVVFSESEDSSLPVRKPRKPNSGPVKKNLNTKPAPVKQSKPRQSLELSSGEDKEDVEDDDNSSNASWNSEDDPDRLWCICKKPHNNRFMICCDSCLDWFHGHCVGVTKAQGKQMEDAGQDWTCPSCKKVKLKTPAKTPAKAAKRQSTSPSGNISTAKKSKPDSKKADKQSQDLSPSQVMFCIVCKKHARVNSVYCSDVCILKHAQTSKSVSPAKVIPKTPSSGPTKSDRHLLEANKGKTKSNASTPKPISLGDVPTSSKTLDKPLDKTQLLVKKTASLPTKVVKVQSSKVTNTSKSSVVVKLHPKASKSVSKTASSPVKKSVEVEQEQCEGLEQVRSAVREGLGSHLYARVQDCEDFKDIFTLDAIKLMAQNIEEEMYLFFGSVGAKYKSKYRSFLFNIKDQSNLTLFRKIVEKSVSPYELVRLTPEELASQQLAQWREQESKHQLDIIKKNELVMMNVNKSIVMKTHKGEEIIEPERGISQTSVLEFDIENSSDVNANSATSTVSDDISAGGQSDMMSSGEVKKDTSRRSEGSTSSSRRSKSGSSRSNSRDRKRSNRNKSTRRDHDRNSRDRSSHKKSRRHDKSRDSDKKTITKKTVLEVVLKMDSSVVKVEETKPLTEDLEIALPVDEVKKASPIESFTEEPLTKIEETPPKVEPKSTPRRKGSEPKISWTGLVSMMDVSKFTANLRVISGDPTATCKDMPDHLEIVGRIEPDVVWQYVTKIKRAGNKEIQAIRLSPASNDEKSRFLTLYTYLSTRHRVGVVGALPPSIKDLYIVPLAKNNPVPSVLLPLDGPGVRDDHPHMLLGVIVRLTGKPLSSSQESSRSLTPPIYPRKKSAKIKVKVSKGAFPPARINSEEYEEGDEPYSPGGDDPENDTVSELMSLPSSDIATKMEELNRKIALEKQEIEIMSSQSSSGKTDESSSQPLSQSQRDEDEAYSPSASYTPPYEPAFTLPTFDPNKPAISIPSNISLPANIQEILANVKKNADAKMDLKADPIVKSYKESRRKTATYTPTAIANAPAAATSDGDPTSVASPTVPATPPRSRDPRSAKAKPSSTLSRLSDAELIEKAAAEMGSHTPPPPEPASTFNYPGNFPPPGFPIPPPNFRPPMPIMGNPRMMPPGPGMMYPPYHMHYRPNYMGPPPPMGYNTGPFPAPIPGGQGFGQEENFGTRSSQRERRNRSRWSPAGPSPRAGKRPGGAKRAKSKDPKPSRGD